MNPDLKNGLMGLLRNCAAVGFVAIVILFRRVYPDGFQLYKIGNMIAEGLDHKYVVDAISFNEYMESAIIIIRSGFPPISFLDLCGSILSCFSYRKNLTSRKSWFESLLSCTLMQFGGTTLTGILLGQTPSWIVSHSAFPALMVAWWFTFFSPYDIFYNTLLRAPFSLFFVGIFSSISGGHAVTSWGVDKALNNTFHVNHVRISQSVLTCIACGTLSASGGGLLCNIFRFYDKSKSYTLSVTPSIFAPGDYGASATITRSFYLAVIYYLLRNQHSYCPWSYQATPELARLAIGTLQVLHFLISSVFSIDLLQNFSVFLLHRVIMIDKLVGPSSKSVSPETGSKENEEGSDGATVLMKSPSKGSKKVDVKKRN